MKTAAKIFITVVGLTVLYAWTIKQTNDIAKAEWLIGTWENLSAGQAGKTSKGSVYETWNKETDNEFSGKSYIIKEQDTIIFENIQLVQEQGGLFYIPTVKNQNDGLPVRFASKIVTETQLVFENPQHDFPQIISYTQITPDSLVAEISGTKNGQERRRSFSMRRVK